MEETTTDTRKRKTEDMPEEERPRKMPVGDMHRPMETGFAEGLGKDVWCNILQYLEASELLGSVNLVNRQMRNYASLAFYMQASARLGPYFRDRLENSLVAYELSKGVEENMNPRDTFFPDNAWLVERLMNGPLAWVQGGAKAPPDKSPWQELVAAGKALVDAAVEDMNLILQSVPDTTCMAKTQKEYDSVPDVLTKNVVARQDARMWFLAEYPLFAAMEPHVSSALEPGKTYSNRRVHFERKQDHILTHLRGRPLFNPALYTGKSTQGDFPPEALTSLVDLGIMVSRGIYEALTVGALKRVLEAASPFMSRFFREMSLVRSFHFARRPLELRELHKIEPWRDRWLSTPRFYSRHTSLQPGIPAQLPSACSPSLVELKKHTLSCPTCFAAQAYRILQFYEKGELGQGGPLSEYLVLEGSTPNLLADAWFRTTKENRQLPCLLEEKRGSRELPEGTCRWQMAFGMDASQTHLSCWGEIWPLRMAVAWLCHRALAIRFLDVTPHWCRVNWAKIRRGPSSAAGPPSSPTSPLPPPSPPAYYRGMTCAHLAAFRLAASLEMEIHTDVRDVESAWELAFWLGHGEENAPLLNSILPLFPLDFFLGHVCYRAAAVVIEQVKNQVEGRGPCGVSRIHFCRELCSTSLRQAEHYLHLRRLDLRPLLREGVTCERLRVGNPAGRLSYLYHILRHALSLLEEWNLGAAYTGKGLGADNIRVLRETLARCRSAVSDLRADLVECRGEAAVERESLCSTVDECAACPYLEDKHLGKLVPFYGASEDPKIAFWTVDAVKRERLTSGPYW
jgi:hypothetical protein